MTEEILNLELIPTKEGIHTLRNNLLKECYHSVHGSLQESMHVFIKNGLQAVNKNQAEIKILEMGFGTGLNALLTYRENLRLNRNLHYTAVESFPLPMNIIRKLNYLEFMDSFLHPVFLKMHECNWFENVLLTSLTENGKNFFLYKIQEDLLELKLEDRYDLVYYDAFSPTHQPELWTLEVFQKIFEACNEGAMLVTYCAKGEVKRSLEKAGFRVETLPGPKGKREMIRAVKGNIQ